MDTVAIFCALDDFCRWFERWWGQRLLELAPKQRRRPVGLCLSEVMTILMGFHLSGYRTFKDYYLGQVLRDQRSYFPGLVSYNRFVELLPGTLVPWCCFLVSRFGRCRGISFIDSTKISVCHNRRIWSHKVMAEFAARGKTSVDWFYGFKLPLVINDQGELLGVKITAGNVQERNPVPQQAPPLFDKLLLRKRSIIETVNDQLKNISQIEHSRHRSPFNFFVNLMAGLVAYTFHEKKPSLNLRLPQALPAVVL